MWDDFACLQLNLFESVCKSMPVSENICGAISCHTLINIFEIMTGCLICLWPVRNSRQVASHWHSYMSFGVRGSAQSCANTPGTNIRFLGHTWCRYMDTLMVFCCRGSRKRWIPVLCSRSPSSASGKFCYLVHFIYFIALWWFSGVVVRTVML